MRLVRSRHVGPTMVAAALLGAVAGPPAPAAAVVPDEVAVPGGSDSALDGLPGAGPSVGSALNPDATGQATATRASTPDRRMVREINEFRGANGRPPLRFSGSLDRSAQRQARWVIDEDRFSHRSSIHASPSFDRLGEVLEIHSGSDPYVAGAVRGWRRSPGHRRVLLDPSFRFVGPGRSVGDFRGREMTVWAVQVGAR